MFRPVRTVAPSEPVITTAVAKSFLRVDHSDDDATIDALVQAATDHLDGWSGTLGRCLVTQTWRQDFYDWPASGCFRLPFPNVQSVTSVAYYDAEDAPQVVSASLYELLEDEQGSFVRFLDDFTSPTVYDDRSDAVSVTFVAGYGAASSVPAPLVTAIKMLVAYWYQHREAAGTAELHAVPFAVEALTDPYRFNRI